MHVYFQKYMSIQDEIEDDLFVCEGVHVNMCRKYKNAKKENTGQSLWRKYKTGRGQGRRVCLKHLSLQFTPNPSNRVRTKFINFNLCTLFTTLLLVITVSQTVMTKYFKMIRQQRLSLAKLYRQPRFTLCFWTCSVTVQPNATIPNWPTPSKSGQSVLHLIQKEVV